MADKNLFEYTEDSIKSLDWREHIRLRPGMYIGKLGDGSSPDDGIYVLVKEVLDNCIDEYTMGHGKTIDITKAMTEPVNITSGSSASFSILMDKKEVSYKIRNFSLIADSDQYLSPEQSVHSPKDH